ncbi:putative sigma-54 modulation protein [Lebetimonas natsushimae]|uniref:Ribosome hibernation promoting factor n=1 Tax=Lebetimonas natsushimae TaxID=1936991 RepID=A0A292YDY0_9BACT|nr:ribosome-associated translation inhibitor RaiA [Lebetimonas natsushimae]GAX88117.1 putative sigma-54 modulation protein [Lebetimonas natsushimae]
MNVTVVGRNIELTESMKDHVKKVINEVEKYNLGILHSVVTIEKDKRDFFNVEIIMNIPNKGTAVVHYRDKDMYAALDKAKDKLEKLLRRYHDKIKDYHKNDRIEELIVEEANDEIVEMPLDVEKPLTIDEAVEEFKKSGLYFMVFKDTNGEKRVIYRRKDGRLGLY